MSVKTVYVCDKCNNETRKSNAFEVYLNIKSYEYPPDYLKGQTAVICGNCAVTLGFKKPKKPTKQPTLTPMEQLAEAVAMVVHAEMEAQQNG